VFTPTSPVRDAHLLIGRQRVTQRIERALDTAGKSVVVFGRRGVGKTSLCKLAARKHSLFYRSMGRADSFDSVLVSLFERFELSWSAVEIEESETTEKSAEVGIAGTGGALAHHRERRHRIRPPSLPLTPDQLAEKLCNVRGVAIIDDFDILPDATCFAFSELVKKLSDHAASLSLVLVGVADEPAELVRNFDEVRPRIDAIEVTSLNASELRLLIRRALDRISGELRDRITMSDDVVEDILRRSGNLPHEVHQYCLDCGLALCDRLDAAEKDELTIGGAELELAEALFRATVG
jgi:type II secretory pathway predicted ATPase ExeA